MNKYDILVQELGGNHEIFRKSFYKSIKELVETQSWIIEDVEPTEDQLKLIGQVDANLLYYMKCKWEIFHPILLKHIILKYWKFESLFEDVNITKINHAADLQRLPRKYLTDEDIAFITEMTLVKLTS